MLRHVTKRAELYAAFTKNSVIREIRAKKINILL